MTTDTDSSKHIRQVAGVFVLKKKHPILKRLKKSWPAPEIHGDKIWASSYLVMNYLEENPIPPRSRVMELGCGWGLISIYCARKFKARVVGVDADANVLPYLKVHSALNEVKVKTHRGYFEKVPRKKLAKQDLVLGSDICFWPKLVDPLYKIIKRSVKAGVKTIIIADPGRSPFLKLAKKCKKKFDAELIDTTVSSPGEADGYLLVIKT